MKKAYGYDHEGFYTSEVKRQKDNINDVFLMPANSTLEPPIENLDPRKTAKWNQELEIWELAFRPSFLRDEYKKFFNSLDDNKVKKYKLDKDGVCVERSLNEKKDEIIVNKKQELRGLKFQAIMKIKDTASLLWLNGCTTVVKNQWKAYYNSILAIDEDSVDENTNINDLMPSEPNNLLN